MHRLRFVLWVLALVACLPISPLRAQTLADEVLRTPGALGTWETSHQRQQRQGVLDGCMIVFKATARDFAYQGGTPVMVTGSFAIYMPKGGNPGFMLKVGLSDLRVNPPRVAAPHFAYLQAGSKNLASAIVQSEQSETPGYKLWVGGLKSEVVQVIAQMIDSEQMTIGFNRREGGGDVLVPIDLRVSELRTTNRGFEPVRSPETMDQFNQCFRDLANAWKAP